MKSAASARLLAAGALALSSGACDPVEGAIFESLPTDASGGSTIGDSSVTAGPLTRGASMSNVTDWTGGSAGSTDGSSPADDVPAGAHCESVVDWDEESRAAELEMLERINQMRATGAYCAPATHQLELSPALRCSARLHARDMVERDFYDTTNPDGIGPGARMNAAGFTGAIWGENVTRGFFTPEDAIADLMASESLCVQMLDPDYVYAGFGRFGDSWTQDFGSS